MNTQLAFFARLLMASLFLISAYNKIMGFKVVAGVMAAKGFPAPEAMLVLTILLETIGALLLIANWHAALAAVALAVFTFVSGTIFHDFWQAKPEVAVSEMNHFLKNIAIVGGLLLVAALPRPARDGETQPSPVRRFFVRLII